MNHTENWFIERIGQKIYSYNDSCSCSICKDHIINGIVVVDELHADYLYQCELEGIRKYFVRNT